VTPVWTPVKQISRVAHPGSSRVRLLAALIAYFDESGKPDDRPVVSLAAVVAVEPKWFRFEVSWKKALHDYGAPSDKTFKVPFFHMTDFESRHAKPYGKWNKNKRIGFVSKLASIVNRTILFGSVHSLVVEEWNEIIVPHLSKYEEQRGWYIFLLQYVLADIAKMVKVPRHESIACVFDTNNEVSHAAKLHFDGLKKFQKWENLFGSATYESSVKFSPLQAADMLAFEGRMAVHNKIIDGGARPIRKLLDSLQASGRVKVARYDREGLSEFRKHWLAFRKHQERLRQEGMHP